MPNRLQTLAVALGLALAGADPTSAAPIRILCLGDSITQGLDGLPSYRDPLIRILNGENVNGANPNQTVYSFDFVGSLSTTAGNPPNPQNSSFPNSLGIDPDHEGHAGWRADEILDGALDPDDGTGSGNLAQWLSGYTADIALVHIGTNDALRDFWTEPDDNFEMNTWNEIAQIVQAIQADPPAAPQVFLAKIIPVRDWGTPEFNAIQLTIDDLNFVIGELADTVGAQLVEFTGFDAVNMMADSYHPNSAGEAHMVAAWFTAMKPTLDELSKPHITSAGTAGGTFGTAFSFAITAENNPTGFGASDLPPGLSVNTSTGVISGTPTAAGTYNSTVSATNAFGTRESALTITIAKAAATVSLDDLVATFNGSSQSPTVATTPSGLSVDVTYDGSPTPPSDAGDYAVVASVIDANLEGTATDIFVILTPIEGWRLVHFNDTANSGEAADDADADGDGIVNLLEFGFALDPNVPQPSPVVTEVVDGYLTITVPRNPAALDLDYTAESGSDPADLRAEWAEELPPLVPNTFRARDTVLVNSAAGRFIRVRITRPTAD